MISLNVLTSILLYFIKLVSSVYLHCTHLLAGTGTADYEVYPCPNGTFSNNTGLKDEDGCLDCTAGWACVGLALTEPNVLCQAGYYCQGRAKTPTPLDTITGDKCPEGYYCPQGQGIIISFWF